MRKAKYSLLLIVALLVVGQFSLSLLTNYASHLVPPVFVKCPFLVWLLIAILLAATVVLTLSQYLREHRGDVSVQNNSPVKNLEVSMSASTHKHDVFVSYSHKNADWVRNELVPRLENHGFQVFTDTNFVGGTLGVDQMEEGVRDSKRVLAVFTPAYFQSEWSTLENVMAQILDPAARRRKLIPVLREDCDIPLRLKGIHYRDLRNDGEESEWEKLIQDLM